MGQGAGMQGAASPGGSAFGGPMMGGPPMQGGGGNTYGQVPTNMAMGGQPTQGDQGPMFQPGYDVSIPWSQITGQPMGQSGQPQPTAPPTQSLPQSLQYNYGTQAGQPYNPNLQYPGAGMVANTATGAGSLNPMAVQQALQQRGLNPMMLRALGLG